MKLKDMTIKLLSYEMSAWQRGPRNMRFGQYIWNIYGVPGESWPELFYEKDSLKAFNLIQNHIFVEQKLTHVN